MKGIAATAIVRCHTALRLEAVRIEMLALNGWFRSSTDLKAAECLGE